MWKAAVSLHSTILLESGKMTKMTVKEVAKKTGKSEKTIYRYIKKGILKAELITRPEGQLYQICEKAIEEAGIPFFRKNSFSLDKEIIGELTGISQVTKEDQNKVMINYLQCEIQRLREKNDDLLKEVKRAIYLIGVYKGKLEATERKMIINKKSHVKMEMKMVKFQKDAEFYKKKYREEKKRTFIQTVVQFFQNKDTSIKTE
jgi:excisionase family DNA binding protein